MTDFFIHCEVFVHCNVKEGRWLGEWSEGRPSGRFSFPSLSCCTAHLGTFFFSRRPELNVW